MFSRLTELVEQARARAARAVGRRPRLRSPYLDYAMEVPFQYLMDGGRVRSRPIAVVCHIFHAELTGELVGYVRNIDGPMDLYISTDTDDKRIAILAAVGDWSFGSVTVRVLENRGRDIAPKLVGFRDVYERHDLVLFLHSKKATHENEGGFWRGFMLTNLAGSKLTTRSVLEIFALHPEVGVVMTQHIAPLTPFLQWVDTYEDARKLADRMGLKIRKTAVIDFPAGSMFWVRSAALQPLLRLNLTNEDFQPEAGQSGGTMAHALERLFVFSAELAGFTWVKIADRSTPTKRGRTVTIRSPKDLSRFIKRHRYRLLPKHGNP